MEEIGYNRNALYVGVVGTPAHWDKESWEKQLRKGRRLQVVRVIAGPERKDDGSKRQGNA